MVVPNLFQPGLQNEAKKLYTIYLSQLSANSRNRRVLTACEMIKAYAVEAKQPQVANFTFHYEIEALCKLGRFIEAWKLLRQLEHQAYGKPIDLRAAHWKPKHLDWFWQYHPHILYFLGRYQLGRRMLEAALGARMAHPDPGLSYQLLPYVHSAVLRPHHLHQVALYHFYRKLGRDLTAWSGWKQFVEGFDSRVLTMAHLQKEELLGDASKLRGLHRSISRMQAQRLSAGISTGERELVDAPNKVKGLQRELALRASLQDGMAARDAERLRRIFPELKHQPHQRGRRRV
jgi:hypothetical protein